MDIDAQIAELTEDMDPVDIFSACVIMVDEVYSGDIDGFMESGIPLAIITASQSQTEGVYARLYQALDLFFTDDDEDD